MLKRVFSVYEFLCTLLVSVLLLKFIIALLFTSNTLCFTSDYFSIDNYTDNTLKERQCKKLKEK